MRELWCCKLTPTSTHDTFIWLTGMLSSRPALSKSQIPLLERTCASDEAFMVVI